MPSTLARKLKVNQSWWGVKDYDRAIAHQQHLPDIIVPDPAHPDLIPPVIGEDYYNDPSFPTGTIPKLCRYPTIGLICIYSDGLSEKDKIVIKSLIEDYFFDRQVIFLSDS